MVLVEKIGKCKSGGFAISLAVQQYLASPYIYEAGSEFLKSKYLPKAISGEALCCIAISEPGAGSDVANIQTRAEHQDDHYVLNGSKTFITNGYLADFMVVAAKTAPDAGASGISLFVVDADSPGISRSKLNKLGWHASDTAEIFFEDVRVPAENLIGTEGKGFYYIMDTFQLERLAGSIMGIGAMDDALAMTLSYMAERKASFPDSNV